MAQTSLPCRRHAELQEQELAHAHFLRGSVTRLAHSLRPSCAPHTGSAMPLASTSHQQCDSTATGCLRGGFDTVSAPAGGCFPPCFTLDSVALSRILGGHAVSRRYRYMTHQRHDRDPDESIWAIFALSSAGWRLSGLQRAVAWCCAGLFRGCCETSLWRGLIEVSCWASGCHCLPA